MSQPRLLACSPARLLAFAGSLRADSLNRQLLQVFADAAENAGAEVARIDLRDHAPPIHDGDLKAEGMSPTVADLQALLAAHDGMAC